MNTRRKVYREGQRFGKLIAISYIKQKKYLCRCDCGNEKIVPTCRLLSGNTRSCGCISSISRENYDEDAKKKLLSSIIVKPSGCWEWNKSKHRQGYGHFPYKRKVCLAHRISWILHNGNIPDEILVLHKCDNPPCCNPDHLFLGDDKINAEDKQNKGRGNQRVGSEQWCAKLNEEKVLEIRKRYREGTSLLSLAKEFSVSEGTIYSVVIRRSWRHI